ncbi:MAG: multicopper oxidase domain-containing protein [Methanobacteriota archaeon]
MAEGEPRIGAKGARLAVAAVIVLAVVAVAGLRLSGGSTTPVDKVYISLVVEERIVEVAPGVTMPLYTYDGSVPGPVLRVRQGDVVNFTLTNGANNTLGHSLDFHAAKVAWNVYYRTIAPGQTLTFEWVAEYPGVFMYHCGTPPVLEHIAKGMYGMIVVEPRTELPRADKEFFIVQSELYDTMDEMANATPRYVVFDGYVNRYIAEPLEVDVDDVVRVHFLNAGPSLWSAFHVIGTVFDRVWIDGNPRNVQFGVQTVNVPPSGAVIVDFTFAQAGQNPFVTHSFADASKGAVGLFNVTGGEAPPPPPIGTTTTVRIVPGASSRTTDAFNPNPVVVVIGVNSTVVWVNDDNLAHTATDVNGTFDTSLIQPGQRATVTFTTPGTYEYECLPHPNMRGTIIVQAAPAP